MRRGLATCLLTVLLVACAQEPAPTDTGADLSSLLAAPADGGGFADADRPAALLFPRDHGPHPDFRIEWWYLTANLHDAYGRHYGFQFALFRFALRDGGAADGWDSPQLYMLHAALTDTVARRFRFDERFARPAAGLAGARAEPFAAWLEDCGLREAGGGADVGAVGDVGLEGEAGKAERARTLREFGEVGTVGEAVSAGEVGRAGEGGTIGEVGTVEAVEKPGAAGERLELSCRGEGYAVTLALTPRSPLVRHGEDGWSAKLPGGSLASYYVSWPRLAADGVLSIDGREVAVRGSAWFDHEWSSALLGDLHSGWDWFALQFDDGAGLMLFRIRDRDGAVVALRGTFVDVDGGVQPFVEGDVDVQPLRHWTSPQTGARYPLEWRVTSSRFDLDLHVEPRLDEQELRTSVRYWEGAVTARGRRGGRDVQASGYLELTGYAARP